jgi:hypothetical protein
LILVAIFDIYVFRLHWKEVYDFDHGGGSVQHPSSYDWGKKIEKRNINTKDCSINHTGNRIDSMGKMESEHNMTEDNLVWMTIKVDGNEIKSRENDIKEDINAILQRMENTSLKNSATKNKYKTEDGNKNRGKVNVDRKNERIRKNEYGAECSTKSEDSPTTTSFSRKLTPVVYQSLLNDIINTSAMKATHGKSNENKQINQTNKNNQHEMRSDEDIDRNEEMKVISTCDEDRGSATPNRFWILVGIRPSAVLEIREYSGKEVLGPQFLIDDVSVKISNPNFSGSLTKSSMKVKKSDEWSVEHDTAYKMNNEKMKNICMWAKIVSETIVNLNEKKRMNDLFNQLKRENEVLVRHRDLIMTLQSSSELTDSSRTRESEQEKGKNVTLEVNELKKLIHINNVEKSDNDILREGINRVGKEGSEEHSRTSPSEDSSARTRTTEQRTYFTEELKLLIEQQCVRTLDFLSSLNLTVTQASSYTTISTPGMFLSLQLLSILVPFSTY